MVTIGEELDKAVQGAFTRPIPKSAGAQMRYLVRQYQGSTRRVAELLGISQRTVERYVKNQIKTPRSQLADRLEREVRLCWQPQVTLVGDAGYCPGPAVGGSTSLAVVGAYVLAGELARAGGDHERAFPAYGARWRSTCLVAARPRSARRRP